jgi:CubicO group peptidase (beta-lactamase class C family)
MNTTPKFCKNYESLLDNHFESILKNDQLSIPGFVVLAKRGEEVYHKAFGVSDLKSGKAMQTDSMFRMYSMTKVLTSFVALRNFLISTTQ